VDVEIWWNAKTGQYGGVAWSLRLDGKAGSYVDRVEVRVKPTEAPEAKTLLANSYGLISGGVSLSGPVLKEPVNLTTSWAYDVVALKNGVEVARLDPRVIIRK